MMLDQHTLELLLNLAIVPVIAFLVKHLLAKHEEAVKAIAVNVEKILEKHAEHDVRIALLEAAKPKGRR